MSDFISECLRCGTEFTESLPRVFCPPCRPLAAAEMAERHIETLTKLYLEHPEFPMPGDRVRMRTEDDRAFEHDVMAGLADL